MNLNTANSIWRVNPCYPALVLVVESDETSIWNGEVRELVRKLKHRLPEAQITSANNVAPHGLQSALAAASFCGASSAVVVKLWAGEPTANGHTMADPSNLHLEVISSESPPDVEAIVATYQLAWLAHTLTGGSLPCN